MSDAPLLAVENLRTEFITPDGNVTAANGVTFELDYGEIRGLVGESGAGKSVTARSIMRLIEDPGEITEGSIRFEGEELLTKSDEEMREVRGNQIGMIFQDPLTALNPTFTVGTQIAEAVELHQDVTEEQAWDQAVGMLEEVGIPDAEERADDYPHEFSGGMRQRAIIAMALSCEPDLLIADEPTTALDVTIEAQILDLLTEMSEKYDTSVLFITHDLGVVAQLCDKASVMYAGDIVETATINDLFENPRHPYTQGLLESIPEITDPRNEKLTTIDGTMPNLIELPDGCPFHPRCPNAEEKCTDGYPPMETIPDDKDHLARCIRWNEIDTTWDDRTTEQIDRTIDPAAEQLLEVNGLRKYFDASDGLLDKVRFGDDAPGSLPIGIETTYVKAVDGVDFEIRSGETLGLVGESGCGKSTTAESIIQLLKPTDGEVQFRTRDGDRKRLTDLGKSDLRSVREEMQIIFQDPQSSLNPRKTVGDIVGRPMELHNIATGSEKHDRVEDLLERVGLQAEHADRYPHEFSGGQQQRIGIARALAVNPQFLIADEPTSALDVSVQAKIINLLMDLQREMDLTLLFIAHDLSVVRHICDRIAVMYLGKIMEIGTVEEIFTPPYHPYTEALLSAIPVADPTKTHERIELEGDVPSPLDPPSGCPFHTRCPHYIPGECDEPPLPQWELSEGHRVSCVLDRDELPGRTLASVGSTEHAEDSKKTSDD